MSKIISIASSVGEHQVSMEELGQYIEKAFPEGQAARKFKFLLRDKSIVKKNSCVPDFKPANELPVLFTSSNPNPSTSQRMEVFHKYAVPLSKIIAQEAIDKANTSNEDITHIITTTCTGLSAPGMEMLLSEALNLDRNVKRFAVNFMGCYAAFHALRLADLILKSEKDAKVLVVCIELCSLHFRPEDNDDNLLSTFLFSDGCAAAVLSNDDKGQNCLQILGLDSALIPEGKNDMSWNLASHGFEMVLNKNVPIYLKNNMSTVFFELLEKYNFSREKVKRFAIHPGGKSILKAFEEAINIGSDELQASYDVLSNCGNMSSATVMFVLQKYLDNSSEYSNDEIIYAAAFGPGLTVESGFLQIKNEN